MQRLQITDTGAPALIALLKSAIADDRYPLSERVQTWQGILDKLEPPSARSIGSATPTGLRSTQQR
jgi:hypothetical protein